MLLNALHVYHVQLTGLVHEQVRISQSKSTKEMFGSGLLVGGV